MRKVMHDHDISIYTCKHKVVYGTIQNVDVFMTQCTDRGEITKSFIDLFFRIGMRACGFIILYLNL